MRRRVLEVLLLLVVVAGGVAFIQSAAERGPSIVGVWGPETIQAHPVQLEFRADGVLVARVDDEVKQGGYKLWLPPDDEYVYYLDVTAPDEERIQTILKFETEDIILVQDTNPGKPRPSSFNDRALRFYRVSE